MDLPVLGVSPEMDLHGMWPSVWLLSFRSQCFPCYSIIRMSVLLKTEKYAIVCLYYILPIYQLMHTWLVSAFWPFTNSAAVDIGVQGFVWKYVPSSLGYSPRRGTDGSHSNLCFTF